MDGQYIVDKEYRDIIERKANVAFTECYDLLRKIYQSIEYKQKTTPLL
jgi:hypothetical protein